MTPRLTRRAGALTLIAATAATALAGCNGGMGARLTYDDTEKVKVTEIVLAGGSGDVQVKTSAISETHIKRIVRSSGSDPGVSYRLDGTVLNVDTSCGHNCHVSYEIEAPTGVAVRGRLGSGDLGLTDVATADVTVASGNILLERATGAVSVKSGSGDLTATGLRGATTLTTGSGNIEATEISGGAPVRVRTGSGDVEVTLTQAAPIKAEAGSGNVDLNVPAGSYRLEARTGSGGQKITGITDDPKSKTLIDAHTGSGDLQITANPAA
jgi:hypothetical protein